MIRLWALVSGCVLLVWVGGCASDPVVDRDLCVNLTVDRDDVVIDEAALTSSVGRARQVRVRFGDTPVPDVNGNGVVRVLASDVTVSFERTLRGAEPSAPPDMFTGTGVRVEGASNVSLLGLRATGYKVGVRATEASGLSITGASFDNLWRMHLKSTREKEHTDDWLWPHENDKQEWVSRYGAAVCIERSSSVSVAGVRVRNGQNGIILDRVDAGVLCDNDCSFLSGWGIAMWRSSRNTVSRNALDFCVRGYSHGVYNRGQDSAGLLMFEQCSGNTVVENSITHSGDGVFAFAGKEALGEKASGIEYRRAGCNDNVFVGNDLSFAPAHGLEITFSFGNVIERNVFEGDAICGIWGGYSQGTLIRGNTFKANGLRGYGEGGGINIEHGMLNTISGNTFEGNTVAVKLWDDDDPGLMKTPWAAANHKGSRENEILENTVAQAGGAPFWVRRTQATRVAGNRIGGGAKDVDADSESTFSPEPPQACCVEPSPSVVPAGSTRPVGARHRWRGREWIKMGEWGPIEPSSADR